MKILEINKYFYVKGGAERHFFDVLDLLRNAGNEVAVFSMHHNKNLPSKWSNYFLSTVGYTEEYSFSEKIKGALRMFYSFEAKKKINNILDDFRADVVHIHNIYHQLSPAILFEIKKRNIPIVMTVHDYKIVNPNYSLFHQGKFYNRCLAGKYYQCFLDRCFKNSYAKSFLAMLEAYWHNSILKTYEKNVDIFVVPSEFVKNILTERGVSEEKIRVVAHFIKAKKEKKVLAKSGDKFGLCMGRISKDKGVDKIVDIFKEIKNLKLYLAGSVENNFKIPSSENIKYLGHLNSNKLEECIEAANFVISGSRLPETFGLVALEAISHGKPFIGFSTGAYGEIITNGKNGFLVKDAQEMTSVLRDIVSNKTIFDENSIKEEAGLKYDQQIYQNSIESIFGQFKPNNVDKN